MSAPNTYTVGTRVRLTATFRDDDDALSDTTVVCKTKDPSGNIGTVSTTHASTGVYRANVTIDEAGMWYYRFEGTVTVIAAQDGAFIALPSEFD